jgi:hypothetical protein
MSTLPLQTLTTLNRQQLGEVFKDPRTLLAFERIQLQVAQIIPDTFTAFQNLDFVVTAADPSIPNAHVITEGANIDVASAAGLVTITATPSGASGQIQYNNGGSFGAFTVSGDATLNTTTGVLTLATVATAGTYTKGTYDVKGRLITGATAVLASADFANQGTVHTVLHGNASGNPTWAAVDLAADVAGTLPFGNGGTGQSSYTDGQLLIGNTSTGGLSKATLTAGSGVTITNAGGSITIASSGGSGSVTSVGLAAPSIFTVSGSPVTASGTLTFSLNTQSANLVFAGPSSGGAAAPAFRALASADLPVGSASQLGGVKVDNTTIIASGGVLTAIGVSPGGGGALSYAFPATRFAATDTGGFATYGNVLILAKTITVSAIYAPFNVANIGDVYSAFIATVDASCNITGTVASGSSFTTVATGNQQIEFTIGPTVLSAGVNYAICLVITNRTTGTSLRTMSNASAVSMYPNLPIDMAKMFGVFGATTVIAWFLQTSNAPTSVSAVSHTNTGIYAIGMKFSA